MPGLKFLLSIFLSSAFVFGQQVGNDDYILHHRFFSVEDGLASRYISDATLDSRGFMWFSTFGGISRFDGNAFVSITKKQGLKANTVFRVAADKNAHLFVISQDLSSENNVLNYAQVFDLYSNSFIPISSVFPKLPFSEKLIKDIHCDSTGAAYILKSNPVQLWKSSTDGEFQLIANLAKWEEEIRKSPELINFLHSNFIVSRDQVFISFNYSETAYYITNKHVVPINLFQNQPVQICSNHDLRYLNTGEEGYHQVDENGNDTFIASASTNKFLNKEGIRIYKSNVNSLNSLLIKDSQSKIKFIHNNSAIDLSNIKGLANEKEKAIVKFIQTAENQFWILTNLGIYQLVLSKKYFSNYFNISRSSIYPGTPMRGIYADASFTQKVSDSNDMLIASTWDRLLIQQGENETEIPNAFVKDLRNNLLYSFRIRQLAPEASIAIQGNLSIVIPQVGLVNSNSSSETATFEVYVKDRAGLESNKITTSAVSVIP
jgi:hypothetical protein